MAGAIVSASTGVMGPLLTKLSALIEGEYKLLKGVKRDIKFLRDELTTMNAFLMKLGAMEKIDDPLVKDCRDKIRELSYDIEDCIDLFMYKLNRGKAKAGFVQKTANKIKKLWSRHQIANQIQELKARVTEEAERRLRFKFDEYDSSVGKVEIDPRLPALYVERGKLVGLDEPVAKITEWLMKKGESRQQLKVVSIVGFGGLGKTTLANQVFDNIKGKFECTAFIPVSRNPNVTKILADMLKDVGSHADASDDERQLINKLRAYLQDKRYFVIVDDVWSTKAWKLMKSALPDNDLGSRVITTTRDESVAKSCCPDDHIYKIQRLSEQDSRKLFFKRLPYSESSCPPNLKLVSQEIIKKCCGLPLAIITISSMLARGPSTKEQWEQVRNSIGSAFNSEGMNDILLLSYHDLPSHLKNCLLYLSMFPEDFCIEREDLIWRWIAEGFITEVQGQTLDQIGENYLNDLINRSLVQPIHINYDGRAEACRVHDMVLDLIISLSEGQNFTTIVEGKKYKCSSNKIRRISLQSNCVGNEVMQDIMEKCSHVRSLLSFNGLDKKTHCLSRFDYLGVLVFEDSDKNLGNQHIKYIGSFFQLKYLRIRSYGITELPDQIGDLQNLQILDIRGSAIEKLPPTIGRLQNLVRLLFGRRTLLPDEVGDLQALEVLSYVTVDESMNLVGHLRKLINLKVLAIGPHSSDKVGPDGSGRNQEALESSLTLLCKNGLKSLEIHPTSYMTRDRLMDLLCSASDAPCLQKLVFLCVLKRLPQRIVSLVNLSHLNIGVTKIKHEDLWMLGGLPSLLYISLFLDETPDETLSIGNQQFRCLKEFHLLSLGYGGLRMVCEREAMPNLRRLRLVFTAKEAESSDMGFKFSFEHLASLERLSVEIDCLGGATRSRVEAAEAAIRNTVSIHPGHPTLEIERVFEDRIVEDEDARETPLEDGVTDEKDEQEQS
ncbi:hypothetical protein ACP70R_019845 [Stipagrostis hirtigluma subsp. patula]